MSLLYKRGQADTDDPAFGKALRLACLANRFAYDVISPTSGLGPVNKEELKRLLVEGDDDEIHAMLLNPSAGALLARLFSRKDPFNDLLDDRLSRLVHAAAGNPRINVDESNEDGPDLQAWDIQKGTFKLLVNAPNDKGWVAALHQLLANLSPAVMRLSQSDPRPIIERWHSARATCEIANEEKDFEGAWTQLTLAEELRCLIGAQYGSYFENKQTIYVGSAEAPDLAHRCAFYGNRNLSVEQMKAGYERDGGAFVLAALQNRTIYNASQCRAALEDMLDRKLRWLYMRRLEEFRNARGWEHRDPRPLSESIAEGEEPELEKPPSEEAAALTRIEARVGKIEERVAELMKYGAWGLVILLAVLLFWKH